MSVKRTSWVVEILERGLQSIKDDKKTMATTRVSLALHIAKELLARAKKHQKADAERKSKGG